MAACRLSKRSGLAICAAAISHLPFLLQEEIFYNFGPGNRLGRVHVCMHKRAKQRLKVLTAVLSLLLFFFQHKISVDKTAVC